MSGAVLTSGRFDEVASVAQLRAVRQGGYVVREWGVFTVCGFRALSLVTSGRLSTPNLLVLTDDLAAAKGAGRLVRTRFACARTTAVLGWCCGAGAVLSVLVLVSTGVVWLAGAFVLLPVIGYVGVRWVARRTERSLARLGTVRVIAAHEVDQAMALLQRLDQLTGDVSAREPDANPASMNVPTQVVTVWVADGITAADRALDQIVQRAGTAPAPGYGLRLVWDASKPTATDADSGSQETGS